MVNILAKPTWHLKLAYPTHLLSADLFQTFFQYSVGVRNIHHWIFLLLASLQAFHPFPRPQSCVAIISLQHLDKIESTLCKMHASGLDESLFLFSMSFCASHVAWWKDFISCFGKLKMTVPFFTISTKQMICSCFKNPSVSTCFVYNFCWPEIVNSSSLHCDLMF